MSHAPGPDETDEPSSNAPTVLGATLVGTPQSSVAIVGAMLATTVPFESAMAYARHRQPTLRALTHHPRDGAYAPTAPPEALVDLCLLFAELRSLADGGTLTYPYSTRELVKLAQHYERFPSDGLDGACANVFTFDAFDGRMRSLLASVLARHGVVRAAMSSKRSSSAETTIHYPSREAHARQQRPWCR